MYILTPFYDFISNNPNATAGFAAGFLPSALLYPLEVVKSQFQVGSHGGFKYRDTFSALQTIYTSSGLSGLYRGFPAGLVGSTLSWGMYFWMYNELKISISNSRSSPSPGPIDHWTAAIASSCLVQTLLCPLWVVKLNQQLGNFDSFFGGLSNVYKSEGVRGLYRGLIPSYWGCSHLAVQFVLYEEFKKIQLIENNLLNVLIATILSKSVAMIITNPIEVVKVRLRAANVPVTAGVWGITRAVWRAEGLFGFYRGVGPGLLRILPSQCITFVTYEFVKGLYTNS
jgi:solute carrier family 25 folate transporter 32